MSSPVVVEPPPHSPPAPPATAVAPANGSPTQQLNGSHSPVAVAAEASATDADDRIPPPTEPTTSMDGDVEMTTSEPATEATEPATEEVTAKPEAITEDTPVAEKEEATPMELDAASTERTEAAAAPEPVVIEYKTRGLEDDARAIALAKRRLEIQITFLENARRKIQDESHPDFQQRMVAVDAEREHLLNKAKEKESYWEHCTSVIYAYECEEATSEFMMNCDKLRQEMLEEIHHEIEIINDQRKGSSSSRKTTRKTRSTRTKTGGEEKTFMLDTAQKVKKRVGNVFQQVESKLAQSEVDHDLRELAVSMDAVSKKRRMDATQSPFVAKYHRSNFLYRDAVYQEGDEIFVRNLMNGSDYVAIICSITSTELFVLSEKGKYTRLVFMDLRQGRVLVSPLTSDQTAALNDREERVALRG